MLQRFLSAMTIPRMVFFIAFILFTLFLPLRDPDYFWHLKTGEYLFINKAFPDGDIFSYTMAGEPWVLHEWLFQILLYLVSNNLGDWGVKLTTSILALAPLYILYRTSIKLFPHRLSPIIFVIIGLLLITPFTSPRPHLITLLLFSIFFSLLLSYKYGKLSLKGLYLMPLLIIPWVNSHGGYLSGIVLLSLFSFSELLEYLWTTDKSQAQKKEVKRLFWLTLITFACSSINPYFIGHWLYPFDVMSMETAISNISEWKSPNFQDAWPKGYLTLFILFLLLNIYRTNRPEPVAIIVPLFFATSAFVSVRHIPLAIFTMIPFSVRGLHFLPTGRIHETWRTIQNHYFQTRSKEKSKDLGDKEYLLNWAVLVIITITAVLYYPGYMTDNRDRLNEKIPYYATDFIRSAGLQGRMFNTYRFGGYLINQLYPEQLVFIDGRADLYGDSFLAQYRKIINGNPGWETGFDKFQIDYVVCDNSTALRQLLIQRGDYVLVFNDEVNSVLVKDTPQYAQIIQEHRLAK